MKSPSARIDRKAVLIIVAAAILIGIVIFGIRYAVSRSRFEEELQAMRMARERQQRAMLAEDLPGLEDFYLESDSNDSGVTYSIRDPQIRWSSDDIDRYWIDPHEAGLGDLEKKNDETVRRSLGGDQ